MKSEIFYTNSYKKIENEIKSFLNKYPDFLGKDTVSSTRATGDAIQHILEENFQDIIGRFSKEYSGKFARRAMADMAFTDKKDLYYIVDVKTHRLETKFNMPNLTSVERISRFYEDDTNYYLILMVAYLVLPAVVTARYQYGPCSAPCLHLHFFFPQGAKTFLSVPLITVSQPGSEPFNFSRCFSSLFCTLSLLSLLL